MNIGRNKFFSRKKLLEKFEKNNVTITINVLYAKKEKIYFAYVSKHNLNREKQVILLMIPNGNGREAEPEGWQLWHYLEVKIYQYY